MAGVMGRNAGVVRGRVQSQRQVRGHHVRPLGHGDPGEARVELGCALKCSYNHETLFLSLISAGDWHFKPPAQIEITVGDPRDGFPH